MFPAGVDTLAANLSSAFHHPHLAVVLPRAPNSRHFPTGLSGITSSQQNARHQNNISVHSGVLLFKMLIRSQDDKLSGLVTRERDFLRSLRSEKVVWASKTADKALANSEVTCELSLPPEQKSWSGRRKRWHLPNIPVGAAGGTFMQASTWRRPRRSQGEERWPSLSNKPDSYPDKKGAHNTERGGADAKGRRWWGWRAQQTRLSLRYRVFSQRMWQAEAVAFSDPGVLMKITLSWFRQQNNGLNPPIQPA